MRHSAVINGTYELPLGRGKTFLKTVNRTWDKVIGGWTLSGHRDLPVGIPVYAATGLQSVERWRHAQSGAAVLESGIQRAGDFGRPERYFNPAAFVVPAKEPTATSAGTR